MKRLVIAAVIAGLLVSCAGFPQPETDQESLIIGRLLLEFPDGFFDQAPRTIKHGVRVNIYNSTTKYSFSVNTNNGFYYFVTNGKDKYVLSSYEYATKTSSGTYTIHPKKIEKRLPTGEGKVIYLGDLIFRYAAPKLAKQYGGGSNRTFDYKILDKNSWDKNAVIEYLEKKQPRGKWLSYEFVENKSWMFN